jgi:hypothetical protein
VLFPTHLVAAALLSRVSSLSPWWLVAGAALPDIVDKPLAMVGAVELFHSVGHSGLLVVVAIPVALYSRVGTAVAVGWASHLLLDVVHVVVNGRPWDALFLAWPLAVPPNPLAIPPGSFVVFYIGTPSFFLELLLWVALAALFYRRVLPSDPPSEMPGE